MFFLFASFYHFQGNISTFRNVKHNNILLFIWIFDFYLNSKPIGQIARVW